MLFAVILLTASVAFQGALAHRRAGSMFLEPRVCLSFDLLCNVSDYQARSYNQTIWVAIQKDPLFGFRHGVRCLLQYVRGANSLGVKLGMTAQFLLAHNVDGPLVLYWLLPDDLQENPPLPLDGSNVFLANFSQMYVYAKTVRTTFRGLKTESKAFNSSLAKDSLNYNQSISYSAFCKRGRGYGRRRARNAEAAEQQLETELFSSEEENPGEPPLPLPLRRRGGHRSRNGGGRNGHRGSGSRRRKSRCFDILFKSNGFPVCPIS